MPLGFELLQIPSLVAHFWGEQESGGFLRDTLTRFIGLIVLSMGVQFALTGYRSFMK